MPVEKRGIKFLLKYYKTQQNSEMSKVSEVIVPYTKAPLQLVECQSQQH